jgi:hypothetical protein
MNEQAVVRARGITIREPWISAILCGQKTWEIRGRRTAIRGKIYLIKSGSGCVFGSCDLKDVRGPLALSEMLSSTRLHLMPKDELVKLPYPTTFAWVLGEPRSFPHPIRYDHPSGAITWVNLDRFTDLFPW